MLCFGPQQSFIFVGDKDHHKLSHGQKKNDLTQSKTDITIRQDGKKQLGSKSS